MKIIGSSSPFGWIRRIDLLLTAEFDESTSLKIKGLRSIACIKIFMVDRHVQFVIRRWYSLTYVLAFCSNTSFWVHQNKLKHIWNKKYLAEIEIQFPFSQSRYTHRKRWSNERIEKNPIGIYHNCIVTNLSNVTKVRMLREKNLSAQHENSLSTFKSWLVSIWYYEA